MIERPVLFNGFIVTLCWLLWLVFLDFESLSSFSTCVSVPVFWLAFWAFCSLYHWDFGLAKSCWNIYPFGVVKFFEDKQSHLRWCYSSQKPFAYSYSKTSWPGLQTCLNKRYQSSQPWVWGYHDGSKIYRAKTKLSIWEYPGPNSAHLDYRSEGIRFERIRFERTWDPTRLKIGVLNLGSSQIGLVGGQGRLKSG